MHLAVAAASSQAVTQAVNEAFTVTGGVDYGPCGPVDPRRPHPAGQFRQARSAGAADDLVDLLQSGRDSSGEHHTRQVAGEPAGPGTPVDQQRPAWRSLCARGDGAAGRCLAPTATIVSKAGESAPSRRIRHSSSAATSRSVRPTRALAPPARSCRKARSAIRTAPTMPATSRESFTARIVSSTSATALTAIALPHRRGQGVVHAPRSCRRPERPAAAGEPWRRRPRRIAQRHDHALEEHHAEP